MRERRTKMERAALERYAELISALGTKADALEIVCGIYRTGDMRTLFLESVFGSEILNEAGCLDDTYGDGRWKRRYPSLHHALEHVTQNRTFA